VIRCEYPEKNFTSPETRIIVSPYAENRMIVSSFIWTKHRNVTKIGTDVRTPKGNEFVGVNIAPPLPLFCPENPHFKSRGPENSYKY